MLTLNSDQRSNWRTGGSETGRFWNLHGKGSDGAFLSALGEDYRPGFGIDRNMDDDCAIAPLSNGSGVSADRNRIARLHFLTKPLTEQYDFRPDWSLNRIDMHGRNQLERDRIADRVLHRGAARPIRQRIRRC